MLCCNFSVEDSQNDLISECLAFNYDPFIIVC